ncbi:hypothetical protein ABW19_dt0210069 [Dactylella cylindrospora]|nr:hypothetical protein ABW19_dt0210069 [Dactylella cylindrospora]
MWLEICQSGDGNLKSSKISWPEDAYATHPKCRYLYVSPDNPPQGRGVLYLVNVHIAEHPWGSRPKRKKGRKILVSENGITIKDFVTTVYAPLLFAKTTAKADYQALKARAEARQHPLYRCLVPGLQVKIRVKEPRVVDASREPWPLFNAYANGTNEVFDYFELEDGISRIMRWRTAATMNCPILGGVHPALEWYERGQVVPDGWQAVQVMPGW